MPPVRRTARDPLRILVVFGTRPEAIKLFPVIHALEGDPRFCCRVCVTGQHRDMLDPVLALAGIVPDDDLCVMREGQGLDELTAALVLRLGAVIDRHAPDRIMVQGDTTSAMAAALAAYYRRIPVDHVEAGLRSGDILAPWPEEVNRRIVATLAHLHFAPTATAHVALLAENVAEERIAVTGNTVIDALHWVCRRVAAEPALAAGLGEVERRFAGRRILALTAHRRESLGAAMAGISAGIARLAARDDVAVVCPVHRNPAVREAFEGVLGHLGNVALVPPLDYPAFARLLALSHVVLTDSGGVQEEAPALGKPVLVLRETTERPEGVAAGSARLTGTDPDRIVAETARLLDDPAAYAEMARARSPYGDGRASQRIVARIARECFEAVPPADLDARRRARTVRSPRPAVRVRA